MDARTKMNGHHLLFVITCILQALFFYGGTSEQGVSQNIKSSLPFLSALTICLHILLGTYITNQAEETNKNSANQSPLKNSILLSALMIIIEELTRKFLKEGIVALPLIFLLCSLGVHQDARAYSFYNPETAPQQRLRLLKDHKKASMTKPQRTSSN